MKTRYSADAFVKHGPYDPELECNDIDLDEYQTFSGSDLDKVVKLAESHSLTGEAYSIVKETYRPKYNDWTITDHIYYY